jgi:hypothetical protein
MVDHDRTSLLATERNSAPPLRTLRLCGEFCFVRGMHRRDAEYAEGAQRTSEKNVVTEE